MNATDVLKYGHQEILKAVEAFPRDQWQTEGVCGYWSAKDVIAHLACYERMLIEMVAVLDGQEPGPVLRQRMELGDRFNDRQVEGCSDQSSTEVVNAYSQAYQQAQQLVADIPTDRLRQVGTMPAYGPEYSFDDILVYQYYGHKREHSAQLFAYCDRLGQ